MGPFESDHQPGSGSGSLSRKRWHKDNNDDEGRGGSGRSCKSSKTTGQDCDACKGGRAHNDRQVSDKKDDWEQRLYEDTIGEQPWLLHY
jgi:hypothetical protein